MSAEESNSADQTVRVDPVVPADQTVRVDPVIPAEHGLPARPPATHNAAVFAFKPRAVLPVSRPTPAAAPVTSTSYYTSPMNAQASSYPAYPGQETTAQPYPGFGTAQPSYGGYSSQQDFSGGAYPADQGQQSYYSNYGAEYNATPWQASDPATPISAGGVKGPGLNGQKAAKPERSDNKTVIRTGGGKTWEDPSLLDWPADHHCLFIGNLAGEVTDESLLKAFSKYPSVSKARVIRDSTSSKSKGYGFVSLGDSEEYFQAAKEMTGKYIGSHPVTISRAKKGVTKNGAYKVVEKDAKYYKKYHGKKGGQQSKAGPVSGSGFGAAAQTKPSKEQPQDVFKADASGGIRKHPKGSKIKMLG